MTAPDDQAALDQLRQGLVRAVEVARGLRAERDALRVELAMARQQVADLDAAVERAGDSADQWERTAREALAEVDRLQTELAALRGGRP